MGDRRGEAGFRDHHSAAGARIADAGDRRRALLQQRQFRPAGSAAAGAEYCGQRVSFLSFTQRQYDSADGERHYRVWTAVPDKSAAGRRLSVLYMLDGNAVMDKLNDAFLQQLSAGSRRSSSLLVTRRRCPSIPQPGPGITLRRLRRINLAPENPRCRREKPGVMTCFASC